MNRKKLVSLLSMIVLWEILALSINKPVILPYPLDVFKAMIRQISDTGFYVALGYTIFRMIKGLLLALAFALLSGIISGLFPAFEQYFSVIADIIKTIPNVSYIIIILIWLGSERSVSAISFFILFPTLYTHILMGMHSVEQSVQEISLLDRMPLLTRIRVVHLPYLLPHLFAGIKVSIGLGFKVSIMAEILGAVRAGVGREMSIARTYVEMDEILAWTIWIIIISMLIDAIFDIIIRKFENS